MTITIEAQVWREHGAHVGDNPLWWAEAVAYGNDGVEACRSRCAESWPEAMLLVPVLRAELDRALMAEVYASSSRVQRCGACRDLSFTHTYAGDCQYRTNQTKRRQPVVIGPEMEPTA